MAQPVAYLVVDCHPDPAMLAPIVRTLKSHGDFDCRIVCNDGSDRLDCYASQQEPAPAGTPQQEPVGESLLQELPDRQATGFHAPAVVRRPDIVVFFGSLDPDTGAVFDRLVRQIGANHLPPQATEPAAARKDPARYSAFLSAGMHGQRNDS